jgi:hypothetical protein
LEFCDFTYQASEGCPWGQKERLIFFVQLPVILFKRCFERAGFRADYFREVHGKNHPQQIILSLRFFGYF